VEGKVLRKGASNKFGVKENLKKYKGGGGGGGVCRPRSW